MNAVATVKTFRAAAVLIPEKRLITQKYESLAWLTIMLPAPMLRMANVRAKELFNPSSGNSGITSDDAVITATVDDP